MRQFRIIVLLVVMLVSTGAAIGKTIVNRGNWSEPGSLDPVKQSLVAEYEIFNDLFTGLVQISADGTPVPGMAESWTTSADGRVTTFKLRDGLVWSDGAKLTADDFVFTFRRALDPKTASFVGAMAFKIKNAEKISKGILPATALGVRALDERTFEIELGEPSPTLQWILSQACFWPVPKHVVEKHPSDWAKPGLLVSNGPYTLAEWRHGDHIKLVKNPRYFNAKHVKIDEVNYLPMTDDSAAVNRFRTSDIDLNMNFPPQDESRLRKILPVGAVHVGPAFWVVFLQPNVAKPPFNDPAIRRAVSLAIDRELLTGQVVKAGTIPNYSLLPAGSSSYARAELDFRSWALAKRTAEARRLLLSRGYGPANPLKTTFSMAPSDKRLAVAISAMLKDVYISVEMLTEDDAMSTSRVASGDFEIGLTSWSNFPDPEFFTYMFLSSSHAFNGGYANPGFDAKHYEAARTMDPVLRAKLFRQAEQMVLNDNALVPLYTKANRELVAPYIKGWVDNPFSTHPTQWLWVEKK